MARQIPSDVDGAAEEGSPYVPAHGTRQISFVPKPSGLRFYHSHVAAGGDLDRGTYTGQVGPVLSSPGTIPAPTTTRFSWRLRNSRRPFPRAAIWTWTGWRASCCPRCRPSVKQADDEAKIKTKGYEVGYTLFSINGHMLGHGEPLRVKQGERVLFHILNGSATEIRSLALPGHIFRVVALDGNPVPTQAAVPVLWLGTAERVSAVVEMTHPGVWILGDLADDDRGHGMGIVVEYAGSRANPNGQRRNRSTGTIPSSEEECHDSQTRSDHRDADRQAQCRPQWLQ